MVAPMRMHATSLVETPAEAERWQAMVRASGLFASGRALTRAEVSAPALAAKPALLLQQLRTLKQDEGLVWLDADSQISEGGAARFNDYQALLADAPGGLLGFELIGTPTRRHAPAALLDALNADVWLSNASLVSAAIFLARPCEAAETALARWQELAAAAPPWLSASGAAGEMALFSILLRRAGGATLCAEIYRDDIPSVCNLFYKILGASVFTTPSVARLWAAAGMRAS